MTGYYAVSKAGHDKNEIFIILWEDTEYVYLTDGAKRPVEKPKRKNKRHVQIIKKGIDEQLCQTLRAQKPVKNEEVKRAIKLYKMANDLGGISECPKQM